MAKWKNIALISTIVAPIAFGVGDALAQANRPTDSGDGTTVVLHKRQTEGAEVAGKDAENLYWGDGNEDTSYFGDPWEPEEGISFTAFNLGKIISIGKDGMPEIAGTQVPGAPDGVKWNQILTVSKGVDALDKAKGYNVGDDKSLDDTRSEYVIEFTGLSNFDAVDLRSALDAAEKEGKVTSKDFAKTKSNGTTEQNLANGNWIILEDIKNGEQPSDSIETFATPIILSLPMLNATTDEGKTNWFGTAEDSKLNLYPKNYTDTGNLRVVKTDGQTKKAVKGATIAIMQLSDADKKTALEKELSNDLLSKPLDQIESKLSEYADKDSLKYDVIQNAEQGVVFNDLVPGQTYYVLEIAAPSGYLPNGKLQKATLNRASEVTGDYTIGGDQDTTVDHKGGTYKLVNYDKPNLDKDINVLKPVQVGDLEVTGYTDETNEEPVYDNANADYHNEAAFKNNDLLFGVSRGKAFNYTIDLETNADLGTYTQFGITDNIPYQVNINSWTLYGRFGTGGVLDLKEKPSVTQQGLVPLIQAVDPDGDKPDHSTSDGLHQERVEYNTENIDPTKRGVSFKFYNQESADIFGYPYEVALESDANYRESLAQQTEWISANLIHMWGANSQYSFDDKNQAVQIGATADTKKLMNGEMNIYFKDKFLKAYSSFNKFTTLTDEQGLSSSLVFKMNAQTNSAAQANVGGSNTTVKEGEGDQPRADMINNYVTFNYKNGYVSGSPYDQAQTNAVGWEFQKTDSKGNPISGAGFDLGRRVTSENVENVISQLIGNTNNGNVVSNDTKLHMADKIGFTGSEQSKIDQVTAYLDKQEDNLREAVKGDNETFVWFIHLDAKGEDGTDKNKQPIVDAMDSHMEMGDIYWVTDKRWATTHLSGTERGYFQYCGLADGQYMLHEEIVPKGFKQMEDMKFTIGADNSYYVQNGKSTNDEYPLVTSTGDNQQMVSDNQITGHVGDDAEAGDNWVGIKNYKKSVLPVVGGVGALSLLFIGAIAMIASYIKRKTDMREN
ncbi:prealbumin-like fold domain-containing protein [Weissella confusa]|uniref:prealbumin-like fold domain-containing protein n=1 Tax=Weissella confusa TaxID=1583 RepID=UPI0022E55151|nr:prealbumin-like fold domain-containing protein [Weissella confusa]MEE0001989.1 prealbumin-like fold domain-containing protein [Weissella confusa]